MPRYIPHLVGVVFIAIVLLFTVSIGSTDVDEYGLHYTSGPLEGKEFVKVIPPGSGLNVLGLFDYMDVLPANQRTYIVSENPGEGDVGGDLITAASSDRVSIDFATSSTFELSSDPAALNRFNLEICTKYADGCSPDGDGWDMMLDEYYRKAQESALQTVARQYTTDELITVDLAEFSRQVADLTEEKLTANFGGHFFTDVTFQVQRPVVPAVVQNKYDEKKAAELQTEIKAQEVEQAEQQALAAEKLSDLGSDPNYIKLQQTEILKDAVAKGEIEFWVLPSDSTLTLPTK